LTNQINYDIINTTKQREVKQMANTTTWEPYDSFEGVASWMGYIDYINEDKTLIKRVWDDDQVEIFEKPIDKSRNLCYNKGTKTKKGRYINETSIKRTNLLRRP
jgi:formylmethanofuran dehydrogenase subunit E-like metal-binding protein